MPGFDSYKRIEIEITSKCNARCPGCSRTVKGETHPLLNVADFSYENFIKYVPAKALKNKYLEFCGVFGDAIMHKDVYKIFEYCKTAGASHINLDTNAGVKKSEWWRELAKVIGKNGHVIFSLDGLRDTNHLYRQNVNWDICMNSVEAFIEAGGRARWDYLIFGHNEHQVKEAEALSKRMGFEKFMSKKTGRFYSNVKAQGKKEHQGVNRKGDETQKLTMPDAKYVNKALKKENVLVEKYGSMNDYYDKARINCKVLKDNNIYVSASGHLFPCCWTAGQLYKWWEKPGQNQIWKFINEAGGLDSLSVLNHGFEKVMQGNFFSNIKSSWNKDSCSNGKLKVCSVKCGTEFDPFGEQFV